MLLANILLALAWAALQGELSLQQLVFGYVLGYLTLWGLARGGVVLTGYPDKVRAVFSLVAFMAREFIVANVKMTMDVIGPARRIRPGIVRVPLDAESDLEILLLSTLVNLTPGSIAVDVASDKKALFVHVMHVTSVEAARAEIKTGFERRVIDLLR